MSITDRHALNVEAALNECLDENERVALTEVMAVAYAHPNWEPRQRIMVMLELVKTLLCEEAQLA